MKFRHILIALGIILFLAYLGFLGFKIYSFENQENQSNRTIYFFENKTIYADDSADKIASLQNQISDLNSSLQSFVNPKKEKNPAQEPSNYDLASSIPEETSLPKATLQVTKKECVLYTDFYNWNCE